MSKMVSIQPTSAIAAAVMLSISSANAQATSVAADTGSMENGSVLEEILVTAQKRSEPINRVPLSIVAASGDQLISLGINKPADLTKIVTGFQATTTQIGTPTYYLRGVGFDDISVAARPTVTLYSDEAAIPYSIMALGATLDLERVEVLKGPQGLLFGSNSTGGAINFIAAKPTNTFQSGIDGSFGRFDESSTSGFISGPITDWLSARFAVAHEGRDDWQYDYVTGEKLGKRDNWSGRLTLQGEPTDRFSARLTLFGASDGSESQTPQFTGYNPAKTTPAIVAYPLPPNNPRATSFNEDGSVYPFEKDNYTWQGSLRLDYSLNDELTVTSLTSVAENDVKYGADVDGMALSVLNFGVKGHIKSFTQELRLLGDTAPFNWVVGANFENDKTKERVFTNVRDGNNGLIFRSPPLAQLNLPPLGPIPTVDSTEFTASAVFGNLEYALSDKIKLRGGLRYTNAKTSFKGCVEQYDFTGYTGIFFLFRVPSSFVSPGDCQTISAASIVAGSPRPTLFSGDVEEDNVSWRVGVDFEPIPDTMLYASVSRGYKAGAFSTIAATVDNQYTPVPEEELTSYELGIKSDVVPSKLHINAALFNYDYRHKQLQGTVVDPIFGPLQSLVSIPKSRVQGVEAELTLRLAQGLTVGAMATYVDTEVTDAFTNFNRFGVAGEFEGKSFPNTPKWQVNGNVDYRTPVSSQLTGFIGANAMYRSSTNSDFFPDSRLYIAPYTTVDMQVGIESQDGVWKAALYGRNIFDETYWTNVVCSNSCSRFMGMPATYGIQFSLRNR